MYRVALFSWLAIFASTSVVALADAGGKSDWSYSGRTAPQFWGELNPSYSACGKGKLQSPVNFASSLIHKKDWPEIHMPTLTKSNVTVSKHTIQWTPVDEHKDQRFMVVKGVKYQLAQFHIHTPSEHHVDGLFYDAEIHFVHKSADGKLAVFGVFIEETKEDNPAWMHLLTNVPGMGKSKVVPTLAFLNEVEKMPARGGYFNYLGSLTVPPCNEGVNWFVAATPLRMSMHQINAVAKLIGFSARPVQFNTNLPEVADVPAAAAAADKKDQGSTQGSRASPMSSSDAEQTHTQTVVSHDATEWLTILVVGLVGVAVVAALFMVRVQGRKESGQDGGERMHKVPERDEEERV
ncbi:alpha carbonic anhydrase [Catenaria anguillulae PL171]|uniref:Carbonic anhydrase n=1 Tax=Catenaria anguillulae PL171 TaxID=765915 RepID=A0A1Y2H9R1_9FUNG|nr:alpha carbonic anhydrase [Catenaria anguillulae PL171]